VCIIKDGLYGWKKKNCMVSYYYSSYHPNLSFSKSKLCAMIYFLWQNSPFFLILKKGPKQIWSKAKNNSYPAYLLA
jgi:hypothetical protein